MYGFYQENILFGLSHFSHCDLHQNYYQTLILTIQDIAKNVF